MKQEREFFDAEILVWTPADGALGVGEKVLSRGPNDLLTRLTRWDPGVDTSAAGVIRHSYVEEVFLLAGDLTDLTLGQTFEAGHYACRPPGMPHGPYRTSHGCTMLEIRS